MKPYYEDDAVTLYHGRCEDVLPQLAPGSVDVLLTDPPYFNVKDDDWDRQWAKADEFLGWLSDVLDATMPALKVSASVWMFASAALTSRVEREVIVPRLRLLNSIRWVKQDSIRNRAEIAALRRYIAAWEGLLLAEPKEDEPDEIHKRVFAPVADYIEGERLRSGVDRQTIVVALADAGVYRNLGTGKSRYSDWTHGDSLPTERAYTVLRRTLGEGYLIRSYDSLRQEWDRLECAYQGERRRFSVDRRSGPVTDVWTFPSVEAYPGKHSCEKPLPMLTHMIEVSSRPSDVILDPFAGSGSTLRAAKDAGRRAIGIEMDERWCAKTAQRLSQEVFDFGGAA